MKYTLKTGILFAFLSLVVISAKAQPYTISTVAGNGTAGYSGEGVPATNAINHPGQVVVDGAGNIYLTEYGGQRVRKISPSGTITTIAGTGVTGYSGDGGPATLAKLNNPYGIDVDASGNVYFTDCTNQRIRKISTSGIITTIAGTGVGGYSGDGGPATVAQIWTPNYLRIDASGNIYFTDNQNHRIRKINSSGIVSTIVGTGIGGYTGDGGSATAARISYPGGIWKDNSGNLFVCDFNNHVIRKVNPSGIISTIAGTGTSGATGDGGAATIAKLYKPQDVITDAAGNVYIADTWNNKVRKISTSGIITTIAGTGSATYGGDGGPGTAAQLNTPDGLYVLPSGDVYIVDVYNNRLRKLSTPTPANNPPTFTKGDSASMVLCTVESTAPVPIDTFLRVSDVDLSQTLTWGITTPPAHGALAGSYSTATTGGTVTPASYTYLPTLGYSGTDMFQINVSDGFATDIITIVVTVNTTPTAGAISGLDSVCPGDTIMLSGTVSTGVWSSGITSIASVSSTGVVTGVMPGATTITYTVTNACGTAMATHPVFVKPYADCTTSLIGEFGSKQLDIYPNPNNGTFSVNINSGTGEGATIAVVNILGQEIKAYTLRDNGTFEINLDVPAGIYLLEATVEGRKYISKIMIR